MSKETMFSQAWIARDASGALYIYFVDKPYKQEGCWVTDGHNLYGIGSSLFPFVAWEDEQPTEIEITIKPK